MKMMLIAGLMITLPAIVVAFWFFGQGMMIPALASLFVNSLPFVVAALMLRGKRGGDDMGH